MQEEIFRKTIIGYNKEDVNNYIDNLMIDNRRAVKIKEDNIQNLQKKVSELELNVTRLKEIENQFLNTQEKLQYSIRALEEKNQKIDFLSLKVDELQEKLNQVNEVAEPDHSREEALEEEMMRLKNEILLVKKEKHEITLERDRLKGNDEISREKELRIEELESQLKDYHNNIKALKEKEALLENEKISIGNAILKAQEKADEMDKEFMKHYGMESGKLQKYKSEIDSLRMKTVEVLQLFEGELNMLSNTGSSLGTVRIEPETACSVKTSDMTGAPQIQLIKRG